MRTGIRIVGLVMLFLVSSALLMAQHGHGGAGHSAGWGHSSAGIGLSPIAPFHMPPTVGIGPSSIPGSRPVYGNHFAGQYPGFSNAYGRSQYSRYGPWRRGSRYGRYNYGLPYAYFGAPYYPLFFDGPYADDFDSYNAPAYSESAQGRPGDNSELSAQVQQLSAQINGLQDQLAQGPRPSPRVDESTPASVPPSPPITVVLASGQTLHVQNYAVMGDTFWDFSSQPARKIPISKIDIPASSKASEAEGAEFPQISSGRSSEAR